MFALATLQTGSCFYAEASLDWEPHIHASCPDEMTGVCYHVQLFIG
jgi:hypothetical protein